MTKIFFSFTALTLSLASSSAAVAGPPAAPASDVHVAVESAPHRLGAGYKIGNGLGFVGLDLIAGLSEHFSVGLQASYLSYETSFNETAAGYGFVPFAQYRLFQAGSSPYVNAGPLYASLALNEATASAWGAIANLGWEWIWHSGISLNVGAGVGYLGTIEATDGVSSISREGGANFNLEAGLRYYFF